MKIKTISRTEEDYSRRTKLDITKVHRNRDPALHPFERSREYTKALVATKLDKVFAKPFIGALDGHKDSVNCMSVVRSKNVPLISGSCDGEIRVWDLTRRICFWSVIAHSGFVRGIAPDISGQSFFSCGDDKMIKQWAMQPPSFDSLETAEKEPINTFIAPHTLRSIDHHWVDKQFATSGEAVCIWDSTNASAEPIHSYKWGADSIISVKFNPAEACLLASTASDRSVTLYDLRAAVPMRKFLLATKSNKVVWNPMEPFNFVLASEDNNLYSFDMRNLEKALMIHKDHVSAVTDVSFSPTGREFVSGSYDRTIRIFKSVGGRSREVYYTKRMQKVGCVAFSSDGKFVLSGSDDTNVRVWKAKAAETLGIQAGRQERKSLYTETLKKRFSSMPEIQRIVRDKKMPKSIKKAASLRHIQTDSEHRKQENRKRHSRESDVTMQPERKRAVVKEVT